MEEEHDPDKKIPLQNSAKGKQAPAQVESKAANPVVDTSKNQDEVKKKEMSQNGETAIKPDSSEIKENQDNFDVIGLKDQSRFQPAEFGLNEQDYEIDQQEINGLFRSSQSQNRGFCVQMIISITCLLYILVDTVQIPGITGTLQIIDFITEESFHQYKLNPTAASASVVPKTDKIEDRHTAFLQKTQSSYKANLQTQEYNFEETERKSRVLQKIQSPDDFKEWLMYVVKQQYGDGPTLKNLVSQLDEDHVQAGATFLNNNKVMMDSSYIMGSRLMVKHAAKQQLGSIDHLAKVGRDKRTYNKATLYFDSIDEKYVNQTAFGEYAGKHDGDSATFIQYYPGSLNQAQAMAMLKMLSDTNVISYDLLCMRYELMIYSNDVSLGIIIQFDVFQTNAGFLSTFRDMLIFQPKSNGFSDNLSYLRLSIEIVFAVAMIFTFYKMISNLRLKCTQIIKYRLNEFDLADFAVLVQLLVGIALLATGGILLYSPAYNYEANFHLPTTEYANYIVWIKNAELARIFRIELGIFVIIQMLNLLLVASSFIPSLGIVFLTIKKSLADIATFTSICWLFYFVFVVINFVSFGEKTHGFNNFQNSFLTVFQMFMSQVPYHAMYQADPAVSALVLIIFVICMNFLILNMYTAIVIRIYNKLQARMLFLGEAMARILANHGKKKARNLINFVCCRSTNKKSQDKKTDSSAAPRGLMDEPEDRSGSQKLSQRLKQNWSKVTSTKIMTKEKFERELHKAANEIMIEKNSAEKLRMEQISGRNTESSAQSYRVIKNGAILIMHLVFSLVFYIEWTESSIHSSIRQSVINYINESTFNTTTKLEDIQAGYAKPARRLSNYNFTQIGSSKKVGSTSLRLTYRLYGIKDNPDPSTKEIFPQVKNTTYSLQTKAGDNEQIELKLVNSILESFVQQGSEEKSNFAPFANFSKTYREPSSEFDSFYGEGGYVFEFDRDLKLKNEVINPTLTEFINKSIDNNLNNSSSFLNKLAIFGADWVMFNPNYDFMVYIGLVFNYKPNGQMKTTIQTGSFRRKPKFSQLITLVFWLLFYIYYTIKLFKDLWLTFSNKVSPKKRNNNLNGGRIQEEQKTCLIKFLNFIGIDETRLAGQNFIVKIVLSIIMIIKKIFLTAINLVRATIAFCLADMLNFFELLNTFFSTYLVVIFVDVFMVLYSDRLTENNKSILNDVNKIANLNEQATQYIAFSIYCLCLRLLKLFQFSLEAYMPIATLTEGKKDIINILLILFVFMQANALAAFIIYCPNIQEFSTWTYSFYSMIKILLGDFSLVNKMYTVQPLFTAAFLWLLLTLYTIFILQMFLGIVIGHFELEWKRVEVINASNQQSNNLFAVITRVFKTYFNDRRLELEKQSQDEQNNYYQLNKDQIGTKKCKCPCTWSSFNPSGIFERIVLYCMMNCCKRKQALENDTKIEKSNEPKRPDKDYTKSTRETIKKNPLKPNLAFDSEEAKSKLPYSNESGWGLPSALKRSSEFRSHSGVKTYMNWFDGWALIQYQNDQEKLDYERKKAKQLNYTPSKKIEPEEIRELLKKTPNNIQGILNLEKYWNEDPDEYEKANSNFWMFYLEKQVIMLTKKEYSLENFKSMDCFFSHCLIQKGSSIYNLTEKQKEIFLKTEEEQLKWFGSPEESVEDKYKAWQAIDMLYRYVQQDRIFNQAKEEKKSANEAHPDQQGISLGQPKKGYSKELQHSNIMTLLIAQIERPADQRLKEKEQMLYENSVVDLLSQKNAEGKPKSNPLKFKVVKDMKWRAKKYHRVHELLVMVWRNKLKTHEKFEFWFSFFTTMERVRLWNSLVFTREWFRRVVLFSRKQDSYKDALMVKERLDKEYRQKKAKKSAKQSQQVDQVSESDGEDDQNYFKSIRALYKGFHRRDINKKLREYAREMYIKGVRSEELLLIKVKMDGDIDVVKRDYPGGITSFFNQDSTIKEKEKKQNEIDTFEAQQKKAKQRPQIHSANDQADANTKLQEKKELNLAREVFNADEMLKLWSQFFQGSYKLEDRKKKNKDQQDDCLDGEYKIEIIGEEKARSGDPVEEKLEKMRVMDRYEQIHFFFQAMIDHNTKTLKSCQNLRDEKASWANQQDDLESEEEYDTQNTDKNQVENEEESKKMEGKASASKSSKQNPAKKKQSDKNAGSGNSEDIQQLSKEIKLKLFQDVIELVNEEEERLSLWMMMSQREKLDMMAHQCIDQEAQIMSFLIEVEYGAENNFLKEGKNLRVDIQLENALNQMIFQKYLAYTRLQATFYARKFTEDLIAKTEISSFELYEFAKYLRNLDINIVNKFAVNKTKTKRKGQRTQQRN